MTEHFRDYQRGSNGGGPPPCEKKPREPSFQGAGQVGQITRVCESLKYLSYVGKFAGLVTALDGIPFVDPSVGVIIFAAASLLKDTANRIGDLLDDGKPNKSFKS